MRKNTSKLQHDPEFEQEQLLPEATNGHQHVYERNANGGISITLLLLVLSVSTVFAMSMGEIFQGRDPPQITAAMSNNPSFDRAESSSDMTNVDHVVNSTTEPDNDVVKCSMTGSVSTTTAVSPLEQCQQRRSCLSDEAIEDAIKQASRVIIVMPAKAAGSTLKIFMKKCLNDDFPDYPDFNFLNKQQETKFRNYLLKGERIEIPKIMSSHVFTANSMVNLIEQLPRSTLLIYMHREESSRLKSAIKQVYSLVRLRPKICDVSFIEEKNVCITKEDTLISVIEEQTAEIEHGEPQMLNCDTHDAIENNAPNMMFMHYKQLDKLQRLLAKYNCPHMLEEGALHINVGNEKDRTALVQVGDGKKTVHLEEWIEAKGDMLSFALNLRPPNTCQRKTREIEDDLFECETEFVRV